MSEAITEKEVKQYELLLPLLISTYSEIQELSKRKPESVLNAYKVKSINRLLSPLKELLQHEPVFDFLDILDSDDLPTNSDVALILSQYQTAMDLFQKKYYIRNDRSGKWIWKVK